MNDSTNATLCTLLANHEARTRAALEGVSDDVFRAEPGGDCNSIHGICRHLVRLIGFDLAILGSARADEVPSDETIVDVESATETLVAALGVLRAAIEEHDTGDWITAPDPPRAGKWGNEPTLARLSRPFNDYVNHLGAIRAIRRIAGAPAERTF